MAPTGCRRDGCRQFGDPGHPVEEPEAVALMTALGQAKTRRLSAATLTETLTMIFARRGETGLERAEAFLARLRPRIEPVTAERARLADDALRRFGKGRHPAGLNVGDCFAHALAVKLGEPLRFKGLDVACADVARVKLS